MTELVGNLSLAAAVLAAIGAALCGASGARFDVVRGLRAARWLIFATWLFLTAAASTLMVALQTSDFRFAYVASYTERSLPAGFKFAALWAGQEGSLLLWGWLLATLSSVAVIGWRRQTSREVAFAHSALAFVGAFFAAIILFAANPFELAPVVGLADGRGLNPQLQDLAMIIHPPLLFTGYAGCAIPFAMLVGVLAAGRHAENSEPRSHALGAGRDRWLNLIRRWVLFSWMFLGAGILMGAWWAYIELGWGGYWAWDPVENASLLPWLTSTALLHSIVVQQHRGMFRLWNASLIVLTFVLCILGTYITRSGVIDSVHAFAESEIGMFFLVFLGLCCVLGVGLIVLRRGMLRPDRPLEGLVSREGAFLAANVLLMIMMLVTLVGTIFPLISGAFLQNGVTVKAGFYNRVVAPMAILLVGLMAMAPALAFGAQAARKIAYNLRMPALAVAIVTGGVLVMVTRNAWALLCVATVTLGTAAVIVDFIRVFTSRRRSTGEGAFACAVRVIDKDHRRYGGQLSHLGVMMIVIGVAGSSLFSQQWTQRVQPGDTFVAGNYTMRFVDLGDVRGPNFNAVRATLELTDRDGVAQTVHPEVRFFDMWSDQPNTEVAIRSGWREDLYVTLAGWEQKGTIAVFQVRVNPLVLWIWVGGMLMVAGAMFSMLPRLLALARTAEAPALEKTPNTHVAVQPAASIAAGRIEVAR